MTARLAIAALVAGTMTLAVASEVRIKRSERPLTDRWRTLPVESPGSTQLGISFRPRQAEAIGLDLEVALRRLLAYPFELVRLAAYWDRLEPEPGSFAPAELDWQIEAAERAGKRVIVCVGAVKNFGYPEFYAPLHHLPQPLREGSLVGPVSQAELLAAATTFVTRVVQRYRGHRWPGRSSTRRSTPWAWSTPGVSPRSSWSRRSGRSDVPIRPGRSCSTASSPPRCRCAYSSGGEPATRGIPWPLRLAWPTLSASTTTLATRWPGAAV